MRSSKRSTCEDLTASRFLPLRVFVDGQRINEPDFNTINFDLIPFDTIERIEIIPGAVGDLWEKCNGRGHQHHY